MKGTNLLSVPALEGRGEPPTLATVTAVATCPARRKKRRKVRALCIDDDPAIVDSLARRLARRGIRPLKAYHGEQGYRLACTELPDVVVTDISTPTGDGQFVLERLKRNPSTRDIPVIVLTGLKTSDERRRKQGQVADYFFLKPAPFEHVLVAVRRLARVGRRRRRKHASGDDLAASLALRSRDGASVAEAPAVTRGPAKPN
jgi:twitching motility two-component system response regulator PilH